VLVGEKQTPVGGLIRGKKDWWCLAAGGEKTTLHFNRVVFHIKFRQSVNSCFGVVLCMGSAMFGEVVDI